MLTSIDNFEIDKWVKLQEKCKNYVGNVRFPYFSQKFKGFFKVHIDLLKNLEAEQTNRNSAKGRLLFSLLFS